MPWFARKERPGLPATVSARMSWPRFGPPRAGTCGTGHAGRPERFQAVRQKPRARSTDALTYAGPRKDLRIPLFSTAKNGARIVVDKRSLWQRKALNGSRLRLLIWGVLAAFLVVDYFPVKPLRSTLLAGGRYGF